MKHDLTQSVLRGATINDARKEFSVDRSKFLNASEAAQRAARPAVPSVSVERG